LDDKTRVSLAVGYCDNSKPVPSGELARFFHHMVTGDQVKKRKPHPDPYLKGLEGLGLEASTRHIAIENAPSGIKAAKAAGLKCIAITTTLSEKELEYYKTTRVLMGKTIFSESWLEL